MLVMKKRNIRFIAVAVLLTASIFSYSYLSYISAQDEEAASEVYSPADEEAQGEVYLPDVELVKKIIDAGKRLSRIGS